MKTHSEFEECGLVVVGMVRMGLLEDEGGTKECMGNKAMQCMCMSW